MREKEATRKKKKKKTESAGLIVAFVLLLGENVHEPLKDDESVDVSTLGGTGSETETLS